MRIMKLAGVGSGIAVAATLALSGCYAPAPEPPQVVTVTPPVVAVPSAPATAAAPLTAPTFHTRIDLSPLQGHDMRLQSFAGDVCVADNTGSGFMSHCICAGRDCTCQGTGPTCTP